MSTPTLSGSVGLPVASAAIPRQREGEVDHSKHGGRFGCLILCFDYLQLLEATGRAVRSDNRGVIPASVEPILGRLGLPKETWIDLISNYHQGFGHIVGTSQTLVDRAQRAGRRWYRGRPCCASIFG